LQIFKQYQMKKTIFLFLLAIGSFQFTNAQVKSQSANCQQKINELTTQRDSLEALFNNALYFLDSITGLNIRLKEQVNKQKTELDKTKKQVADQNVRIEKLEADVKRLSPDTKKKSMP